MPEAQEDVREQNASALIRCVSRETLLKEDDAWCRKSDIVYYENTMKVVKNLTLSSEKDNFVQVQPQKIYLRLRRGERENNQPIFIKFDPQDIWKYFSKIELNSKILTINGSNYFVEKNSLKKKKKTEQGRNIAWLWRTRKPWIIPWTCIISWIYLHRWNGTEMI